MTRKDFEVVAEILSRIDKDAVDDKQEEITKLLRTTNPSFNESLFWAAVDDWR